MAQRASAVASDMTASELSKSLVAFAAFEHRSPVGKQSKIINFGFTRL